MVCKSGTWNNAPSATSVWRESVGGMAVYREAQRRQRGCNPIIAKTITREAINFCSEKRLLFSIKLVLYAFFWVIPRRLNCISRRLETLCSCLWRWNRQCVPKRRHIKLLCRGITQKKAYNIQNTAKVWNKKNCFYNQKVFYFLTDPKIPQTRNTPHLYTRIYNCF
jgi:hypothetical protein